MSSVGRIGSTTCSPFPPVVLRKPTSSDLVEELAQQRHRGHEFLPLEIVIGVEVEDEPIGPIETRRPRSPRMELDDAPLHKAHEGRRRARSEIGRGPLAFRHLDARDGLMDRRVRVFLEEALFRPAVRTANEGKRTPREMRHEFRRDACVIRREIALGEAGFGEIELVGMRQRDARDDAFSGRRRAVAAARGSGELGFARVAGAARARAAFSRATSDATLSGRRPTNDGWRSATSSLHSVNAISATSSGRIQCAPFAA